MTIDDTLKARIVTALRTGDRNARSIEDRQEARELVYLLTVATAASEDVGATVAEAPLVAVPGAVADVRAVDTVDGVPVSEPDSIGPKGKRSKQGKGEAGE